MFFQSGILQIGSLILGIIAIILPIIPCFKRKSIAKLNYNIFSYFSFLCCSITIFLPMIDLLHWAMIEDSQSIIDCVPTYAMAELIVLLATICTNIISHKHCTK